MKRLLLALVAGLVLAGCQSEEDSFYNAPKALDKMTPEEVCKFYEHYVANPDLSAHNRALAMDQMRAKGCSAKG
ncbi:lipoprotein [Lichenifustis flavocetrariae]|uniref:Type IV secretion system putative lipoprotein virB7 n=1 Tax=Lichenifustis flavocetrariae TaxID=2949735 RepID=A0AA41YWN9_9HYPH|nr:lipoprotein [Lichenifustis flavocetrariae]MCW6508685.1 lipoprotein [Lichenifustis flavocetrariae]